MQDLRKLPEYRPEYLKARQWAEIQRQAGAKICFTNGVYDILTAGHIKFLEWLDDTLKPIMGGAQWALVVGVNSDDSVRANKGNNRPVNPLEDRIAVMSALWMPDLIVPFFEPTPITLIEVLQPEAIAKGGDYKGQVVVGTDIVKAQHGHILYGPYLEGRSTSQTIERVYRATHPCHSCAGTGEMPGVAGPPFDPNNPHVLTCVSCQGKGYE